MYKYILRNIMDVINEYHGLWVAVIITVLTIKMFFKFREVSDLITIKVLLFMVIVVTVLPFLIFILITFMLYREVINAILSVRYRSKFGGLIKGIDNAFVFERMTKSVIKAAYIIEYDKRNSNSFYNFAEEQIRRVCLSPRVKNCPKVFSVIKKFYGYSYILKDEVTIDDCIGKLKAVKCSSEDITREDLLNIYNEYNEIPLTNNRRPLWEVLIGTQPVKWEEENENNSVYYPVLFRYNHILRDGYGLLKIIYEIFSTEKNVHLPPDARRNLNKSEGLKKITLQALFQRIITKLFSYGKQFFIVWFCMAKYLEASLTLEKRRNPLHGPQLSKQETFVAVEKSPNCINVIKRIKQSIPGSTFVDILLTALSASLNEYYERHFSEVPNYITITIPELPRSVAALNASIDKIHCQNALTFSVFQIPISINCENGSASLTKRLQQIKTENFCRSSDITEATYLILKMFIGPAPEPVVMLMMNMMNITAVISNIPGPNHTAYLGGYPLKDIIMISPNRERTGLSLVSYTYCNRLNLMLSIDKSLFCGKDPQAILDNVYKYLELLESESNNVALK